MDLPDNFHYSDDCHPDEDDFARKNAGEMPDDEVQALAQHLRECRDCLLAALASLLEHQGGVVRTKPHHRSDTEENIN